MKRDAAEILKDALALPSEARAALAGSLLDSLETDVDAHATIKLLEAIKDIKNYSLPSGGDGEA